MKANADIAEPASKSDTDSNEVATPSASTVEGAAAKKENIVKEDVPAAAADPPTPAKKKKKKAKTTYRNMMAGMLEEKSRDIEKEKEKLKEVTGGGHFQKIDKI